MNFNIEYFEEVKSTNSLVFEQARFGKREGYVAVTEHQTAGKGKPGTRWVSPKGKNLLFSLLIRPPIKASEAPMITQITCRSIARVLRGNYHIRCEFKRPNDLLVKGRKICGILVESSSRASGKIDFMVIGIGLNVNANPNEMVTHSTSMRYEKGKEFDRKLLFKRVLHQLQKDITPVYDYTS